MPKSGEIRTRLQRAVDIIACMLEIFVLVIARNDPIVWSNRSDHNLQSLNGNSQSEVQRF